MTTWLSVLAIADLPGWALYAGLGALGLGLLGVLTMAVPVEREMTTEERVSRYTTGVAPGLAVRPGGQPRHRQVGGAEPAQAQQEPGDAHRRSSRGREAAS